MLLSIDHEDGGKIVEDRIQAERQANEVNHGMMDLNDSCINRCEQAGDSSMGEVYLDTDIIDQSSILDGEVEKRLNDMVAIPVSTSLGKLHLLGFEGFSC